MKGGALLVMAALCYAVTLSAETPKVSGHLKYQLSGFQSDSDSLTALVGSKQFEGHEFDARLKSSGGIGVKDIDWQLDGELLVSAGQERRIQRRQQELFLFGITGAHDDDRRLFDLTHEIVDDSDALALTRIDRAALRYTKNALVLSVGRQAVTWGNGLVFQAMDLFNPFSPVEIDKDYKTGDDLVYAQYLLSDSSDAQFLIVPRRDVLSRNIEHEESSYAGKYHKSLFEYGIDIDVLTARHYNDSLIGVGMSASVAGAIVRSDIVLTRLSSEDSEFSAVVNVDRGFTIAGVNTYVFLEYFRNGFGQAGSVHTELSAQLTERIARGELFSLGRDMIAVGGRVELTPRHNAYVSSLFNLHDGSGFGQYRTELDLYQDVMLLLGFNLPFGSNGSEFGGLQVAGTDRFLSPSSSVYARLSYFF